MLRKNYTLLFVFFLSTQVISAQTVNGIPLKQMDAKYLQLVGTGRSFQPNMHVTVDYGQQSTSIQRRGHPILDDFGQPIIFNSMMHALNFMTVYGYELFEAQVSVNSDNMHTYYYVLKRISEE